MKSRFTFTGWFTDDGTEIPFDLSTPITEDLVLFAGWDPIIHTVEFLPIDASYNPINMGGYWTVPVSHGDPVAAPLEDPIYPGYTLLGWYLDLDASRIDPSITPVLYDFNAPVTSDLFIEGDWVKNENEECYVDEESSGEVVEWICVITDEGGDDLSDEDSDGTEPTDDDQAPTVTGPDQLPATGSEGTRALGITALVTLLGGAALLLVRRRQITQHTM